MKPRTQLTFVVGLVLSCVLLGCYNVQSRESVIGKYTLDRDNQRIVLDVDANGTFVETIALKSGGVLKQKGTWNFASANSRISFDSLWIPKEFAPDYILRADETSAGQAKYTEPGHWILSAERRWGKVVMDVFPDDEIAFRKIG